jgi:ubiquinone/menaquinone biosynthesis C-methylase UbiE
VISVHKDAWYFQEDIVKTYESWYTGKYKRADKLEKTLLKKLLRTLEPAESLFEVGCGTAHFTKWFESLGLKCYGLDLSALMLKEAKALWLNGSLFQGESSYMPFKDKSFDVVVFVACMEYMPNPVKVLREASRVARKGIIIGLMNKWSLPTIRRIIQVKMNKNPYYKNAKFYSILDMKQMLEDALDDKYTIPFWSTTVFSKFFGDLGSSYFPFGAFLGIAIRLK